MKTKKDGIVPSERVKSFRKKKLPSGSIGLTLSAMLIKAVYIDPAQVRTMIASIIIKRQLRT
jgi:hypothetical protein